MSAVEPLRFRCTARPSVKKETKKKKKSVIRGKRIREKTDTRFIKVLYPFSIVEEDLLESYEKFN